MPAEMIRQSEGLSQYAVCYDGYKEIRFELNGSRSKCSPRDAPRKHGLRPSVVILDELHVFPNRDLYKALMTVFGATIKPLTIMISTVGFDRTSLCWGAMELRTRCEGWADPRPGIPPPLVGDGPGRGLDRRGGLWKAMPALGDFCQLDFIRSECLTAQNTPGYENTFRQAIEPVDAATRAGSRSRSGGNAAISSPRRSPAGPATGAWTWELPGTWPYLCCSSRPRPRTRDTGSCGTAGCRQTDPGGTSRGTRSDTPSGSDRAT